MLVGLGIGFVTLFLLGPLLLYGLPGLTKAVYNISPLLALIAIPLLLVGLMLFIYWIGLRVDKNIDQEAGRVIHSEGKSDD